MTKFVNATKAREDFPKLLEDAQNERIVVTRHGKPEILIIGVRGREIEEIVNAGNKL